MATTTKAKSKPTPNGKPRPKAPLPPAHDPTTPDGAEAILRATTSLDEWNAACTRLRDANGGECPDWLRAILVGTRLTAGIYWQVSRGWAA